MVPLTAQRSSRSYDLSSQTCIHMRDQTADAAPDVVKEAHQPKAASNPITPRNTMSIMTANHHFDPLLPFPRPHLSMHVCPFDAQRKPYPPSPSRIFPAGTFRRLSCPPNPVSDPQLPQKLLRPAVPNAPRKIPPRGEKARCGFPAHRRRGENGDRGKTRRDVRGDGSVFFLGCAFKLPGFLGGIASYGKSDNRCRCRAKERRAKGEVAMASTAFGRIFVDRYRGRYHKGWRPSKGFAFIMQAAVMTPDTVGTYRTAIVWRLNVAVPRIRMVKCYVSHQTSKLQTNVIRVPVRNLGDIEASLSYSAATYELYIY
nr:hypothetical protein CFP56_52859 [Quercus suber]